jgi:hypothetical protein
MNTRSYRTHRLALQQELGESARRAQLNRLMREVEQQRREAAGLPAIDPSDLRIAFGADLTDAARQLAALSYPQLARQAVAYAAHLSERRGTVVSSSDIFINFLRGIAKYHTEA